MIDPRLSLFEGKEKPDFHIAHKFYTKGNDYNLQLNLGETVKANENFYVGKQWEGVVSNGLPTPIINIMKRVVGYVTATIASENVKANVVPLLNVPSPDKLLKPVDVLQKEFDALTEHNRIPQLLREQCRNAEIDGECATFTYWDADAETGQEAKGAIKTELVDNTRVFFGNPTDRRVQSQPYIQITSREMVRSVMRRAKENGSQTWEQIKPDDEDSNSVDSSKRTDGMVTVILTMWKDEETGEVWAYESTATAEVKKPWGLGIRLYPVTWFVWDRVKDSYHGQALLTGLIPNQIAINKLCAMFVLSTMKMGFPKYVFDGTRISNIDNRVGSAIKVNGGDINNVIKVIDPPPVSPQITQLVEMLIQQTEQSLGATSAALGDERADNTSALLTMKRSSTAPLELPKQDLYWCGEELYDIYLEFISEYYGTRMIMQPANEAGNLQMAAQFAGMPIDAEIPLPFDFGIFKTMPMMLKIDVGTSSFFSEQEAVSTLNNLLMQQMIDMVQYLERIPDEFIPNRIGLLNDKKKEKEAAMMQAGMQMGGMPPMGEEQPEEQLPVPGAEPEIQGGKGNRSLQRAIDSEAAAAAIV